MELPARRRLVRPSAALTAAALGVAGVVLAAPAHAAVVTVSSIEDVRAAWNDGDTAVLVTDISGAVGDYLATTSTTATLDLAGHVLTIPTPGNEMPAVVVIPGRTVTIIDSVGTGRLVAQGGRGAAGIGGYNASYGTSKNCGSLVVDGAHVVATGGDAWSGPRGAGAGIGGGGGVAGMDGGVGGTGCAITVDDGWVEATGGSGAGIGADAPAIGGGSSSGDVGSYGNGPGSLVAAGPGTIGTMGPGRDPSLSGQDGQAVTVTASTGTSGWTRQSDYATGSTPAYASLRFAHEITFDAAGGTALPAQTVPFAGTATVLVPTRGGYTFAGWRAGSASGPAWDATAPVTAPLTVVATWTAVPVSTPPISTPPVSTPPVGNAPAATGAVRLTVTTGQPAAGRDVTVEATGVSPGAAWALTLHSTPVVLASGTVPADGRLTTTAQLPSSVPAGSHRVELVTTGADGQAFTTASWFRVAADGTVVGVSTTGPVPDVLAATGVGDAVPLTVLGGLLVLAGGGALVGTRRRAG